MVTYAQIQRERPGRITLLAIVCLVSGIPMFLLGLAGTSKFIELRDTKGALLFLFTVVLFGALTTITGLGLLAMKPWSRIAGVIACALGSVSSLQGLPGVFRERSIANIVLNVAVLFVQIWIGYFLLQPSTRELFLQAQGSDERVLKL